MRKLWRGIKYRLINILRIKAGAHQIALGFVMGFFPCWFPTFGIGPALSVGMTKLIKGNVMTAIFAAAVGSIFWPVLFFMNYKIGAIMRRFSEVKDSIIVELSEITKEELQELEYFDTVDQINNLGQVGRDFLVGS